MSRFYRIVSTILHPIFLPSMGTLIYLYCLPLPLFFEQKRMVFLIVLGSTFIVPLLTLLLLKLIGVVKTNQVKTIQERKVPVVIMIINYLFLGGVLQNIWQLKELIILSYATAIGLAITSLILYANIKMSLHMLGISSLLSFFIVYGFEYNYLIVIIALLVGLVGLLATARLQLKAHNFKEVVWGSCVGFFTPILLSFFL